MSTTAPLRLASGPSEPSQLRRVFQRTDEDCFRAAIATLLGLTYDEMGDAPDRQEASWEEWTSWADDHGIAFGYADAEDLKVPDGWWIASVGRRGFRWKHAVVMHGNTVVHDPDPAGRTAGRGEIFGGVCVGREIPADFTGAVESYGSPLMGSTYVGAGDADDFNALGSTAWRAPSSADSSLTNGRYVTAGVSLAACEAVAHFNAIHTGKTAGNEMRGGLLLRNPRAAGIPDVNNWLWVGVRIKRKADKWSKWLTVYKRVAGTLTKLSEVEVAQTALSHGKSYASGALRVTVDAAGVVKVYTGPSLDNEPTELTLSVTDSALATAGALASGYIGAYHATEAGNGNGVFNVSDLAAYSSVQAAGNTYAIPSGSTLTVEGSEATDASNNPLPLRGAALLAEPGPNRIAVSTRRNAPDEARTGLTDTSTAVVKYRPAFLGFPGA